MTKTDQWEDDILLLLFNATAIANIADNAASAPLTNLYISLHTSSPGDNPATEQSENEASYTGYAREAVARTVESSTGWTVTSGTCVNDDTITFGACTGGSDTITHFGIGTLVSGNGKLLYYGSVTSLAVSNGITPSFAAGELSISED